MRRRTVIIGSVLGAGALTVGWWFASPRDRLGNSRIMRSGRGEVALNGWIKIARDGQIVVAAPRAEMGQGIHTTLAQLAAEELDARWEDMRVEDATEHTIYRNVEIMLAGLPFSPEEQGAAVDTARWTANRLAGVLGIAATGGSTSTRDAWLPLRVAGAAARAMILAAASRKFEVPEADLLTRESEVHHQDGRRLSSYGELVDLLANGRSPARPVLKARSDFRLIGKSVSRLDVPAKVQGATVFGIDVRLPGMLYAAIRHCPVIGGKLRDVTAPEVLPRGIHSLVRLTNAVAVIGDSWWQANRFLDESGDQALSVQWDFGAGENLATRDLWAQFESMARDAKPDFVRSMRTDSGATGLFPMMRRIEAAYRVPYLAHATMEPMNCTARFDARGNLEVWMPNQSSSLLRSVAAHSANIDPDRVTVHTTSLGGGFGRRAEMDLAREAVAVAREVRGSAVQLIWSREEDICNDFYRPMALGLMSADLDEAGSIAGWDVRFVSQSPSSQFIKRHVGLAELNQPDPTSVENPPYRFGAYRMEAVVPALPVPVGFWRSVGHSQVAFFEECFLDEIAAATRTDPLALRRTLLSGQVRHLAVLERVATASGWHEPPPAGRARGLALHASFGSIVAQVAEISIAGTEIRVHRVTCAIDCGQVVNPAIVVAQMRSGINFGLSAALYGEITLDKGRVQQGNFPDYDVLRLADAPRIDVHIVDTGSHEVGGTGEPGTPPIAPAVGNAIYALTGQRLRSLPFKMA